MEIPLKKSEDQKINSRLAIIGKYWKSFNKAPIACASKDNVILWENERPTDIEDELYGNAISADGIWCAGFSCNEEKVVVWQKGVQGHTKFTAPDSVIDLHWLGNECVAVCSDGLCMPDFLHGEHKKTSFPEELTLVQRRGGSIPSSYQVSDTDIVCAIEHDIVKTDNRSGFVVRYELYGTNTFNCIRTHKVADIFYSLIAACNKYTAIIENAGKPKNDSLKFPAPQLSFYCQEESEGAKPFVRELPADTIQAVEFSPDETVLLIARKYRGECSIIIASWNSKEIVLEGVIPAPAKIWQFVWGKKAKNPYVIMVKPEPVKAYVLNYLEALVEAVSSQEYALDEGGVVPA